MPMFEYFPGIYPWNLAINLALNMGGVLAEIEAVAQPLQRYSSAAEPGAWTEWMRVWEAAGDRVAGLAEQDLKEGRRRTAGKKLHRASLYLFMAERMQRVGDPGRTDVYRRALEHFRSSVRLMGDPVEIVEIPYQHSSLPAYFVHRDAGTGDGPEPCMVFFDGFDVNKEILYYRGIREELVRRGVSMLLVDHPGVGESLRFRGLPAIPEMERAGTACADYLADREDVDHARTGIIGVSLGGYYAPRAAAFDKRFACCVAWGGSNRFGERIQQAIRDPEHASSVTDMVEHARWVFGAADDAQLLDIAGRITMRGVAEHITCPFLITHGIRDRQVPVAEAREVYDAAVNSPRRDLKIFTEDEGGVEHVSSDNPGIAIDYMADWITEVLTGRRD